MQQPTYSEAVNLLREALGNEHATFREDQFENIAAVVDDRKRLFLVRRTGWGKSIIYFTAAGLLRRRGSGPTLIISPLLALMRNQVDMAERFGLRAAILNSENRDEWDKTFSSVERGELDCLFISPERLDNEEFLKGIGETLFPKLGLLVVDEAHCIADWGNDFRPDYRRIARFVGAMPQTIPIIATTATATDEIVNDVVAQLGQNLILSRGPLGRESLTLDVIEGYSLAERLAWLVPAVQTLRQCGSGIIYTLTTDAAALVSEWLMANGINAPTYFSGITADERIERERALLDNSIDALVATTALGMGFDKPDLAFVIHFQSTQSIVHYYQQVGRAGRALERAFCILLTGEEDEEIIDFFRRNALPDPDLVLQVLAEIEKSDGLSSSQMMARLNAPKGTIDRIIKFLKCEQPSPIIKDGTAYQRTAVPFDFPEERRQRLAARRLNERAQMVAYHRAKREGQCLMVQAAHALGDTTVQPCGRCGGCLSAAIVNVPLNEDEIAKAEDFMRRRIIILKPRKRWYATDMPAFGFRANTNIAQNLQVEPGRALAVFQQGATGRRLRSEKYQDMHFSDQTVSEAAELIRAWNPEPRPEWIVPMVSQRRPMLVPEFAQRLARALGLRYVAALHNLRNRQEQKGMENAAFRASNLDGSVGVDTQADLSGPGLLVDDMYDSGATVTIVGALLRQHGAGPVFPFCLSKARNRE